MKGNTCLAVISTGIQTAVTTGSCSGSKMISVGQFNFPDIVTATITDTSDKAGAGVAIQTSTRTITLAAPMYQLNYKSSDLATGPSSTATTPKQKTLTNTTPTAMTTATTGSAVNDNSPPPDTSSVPVASEQGGLPAGTAAGIGVGAGFGVILIVAALGWLWWKRVRRTPAEATWAETQTLKEEPFHQYPFTSPVPGGHGPIEMAGPSHSPVELDPRHAPPELGVHTTAELWAGSARRAYR
jgi:hypothetical protein